MGTEEASIRLFNDMRVRTVWNDADSRWLFSAVDIVAAVTNSSDPRKYWNALKSRQPELSTFCRQLKMTSDDGKRYLTDVVDDLGVTEIISAIPRKSRTQFKKWPAGTGVTADDRSKQKAYSLFDDGLIANIETGTVKDCVRSMLTSSMDFMILRVASVQ